MDARSLLVLCLAVNQAWSHICIFSPRQRGPLDISMPGSHTCTRHTPPCGGQPVETPSVTYTVGQVVFFQWQQNLNHYEPGYAGYMDISIAKDPSSTNFTTLALVTDSYTHSQNNQQNYTAIVRIPDIECDHCVIRARYEAHKPGETTFLQCADVKIVSSKGRSSSDPLKYVPKYKYPKDKSLTPLRRAMKLKEALRKKSKVLNGFGATGTNLYGFAYNPFEPYRSHYISVNSVSGHTEMVNSFDFGIDLPSGVPRLSPVAEDRYMMDEVVAVDYGRNTTSILLHASGDKEAVAKRLYQIGSTNGSLIQEADIFQFTGGAINGLSWYTYGTSVAFRIQPDTKQGMFNFEVGSLDSGRIYTKLAVTPEPEGLYVNFQWFEKDMDNDYAFALVGNENSLVELAARIYVIDLTRPLEGAFFFEMGELDFGGSYMPRAQTVLPENLYVNFQWLETDLSNYTVSYALLGNENSLEELSARIYIFDVYNGGFLKTTELDVSEFTFSAVHSYPESGFMLYAFSPGLWNDPSHAWSLVAVNPFTGNVTKQCDIAPAGIFQRYYGGSVHQGSTNPSGMLYHVMRVEGSEADVIVGVNPKTCERTFSEPTNLRHIHSLQRVVPGQS